MRIAEILNEKRNDILRIAEIHGAKNVRLFGSAARGDTGPDSDVDILIELEDGRSLLDMARLWLDLEDLLGRKVHIVEKEGLHWYIRDKILKEATPL